MPYRVAVEDIEEGHWIAWVLDLPGCFASAATPDEAVQHVPASIGAYAQWRSAHGRPMVPEGAREQAIALDLVEVSHAFSDGVNGDDYRVNAFFAADEPPLSTADVEHGLWLLSCTRQDLLDVLDVLGVLARHSPTDPSLPDRAETARASIQGILRHIATAERWYFGLLGCEQEPLCDDPRQALERGRTHSQRWLLDLAGDGRIRVWRRERWSVRKVLRRTLWHERDHTDQIRHLSDAPPLG